MDKPTANQLLEAINCFEHVTTSKMAMISDRSEARQLLLKAITSHGEAMAAWGAAQYKEDAERYRHLKAKCVREAQPDDGTLLIHFVCDFENYDDIDAAIDKARGAEPPKDGGAG